MAVQAAVGFFLLIVAIILLAVLVQSYSRESMVVPEEDIQRNTAPVDRVIYRE